jgi:hypothetical protein
MEYGIREIPGKSDLSKVLISHLLVECQLYIETEERV